MSADGINEDELVVCNACFCCNALLYLDVPACLGCSGKGACLCIRDGCCVKMNFPNFGIGINTDKKQETDFFQLALFCCECAIQQPIICCKGQGQMCCLVENLACVYPLSDEVPMMCGLCTVVLYPKFAIFKSQKEINS